MTASGTLEDGTLPIPLSEDKIQNLSLPVDLQTGEGLPYSMKSSDGRMFFSLVKSDCSARVIVNMTATGTIAPSEGCKWPPAAAQASYGDAVENSETLRSGATVVLFETALPRRFYCVRCCSLARLNGASIISFVVAEGEAFTGADQALKLRSGSNTVLRSGSTTVYLTGGKA